MKEELFKWITVAKMAVYDKGRAEQYLPLMQSRGGAVQAVLSLLAALEQKREVPAPIRPMLAMNIYMMMVDVAMGATGEQPSKEAMVQTMKALMQGLEQPGAQPGAQPQPAQPQQAPQGMLAMGGVQ